jgi:hypothetical protein
MEQCKYRYSDKVARKKNTPFKRRCVIDFKKCEYTKNPESCPTYYYFNNQEEQVDVVEISYLPTPGKTDARGQSLPTRRGSHTLPDIVININLGK